MKDKLYSYVNPRCLLDKLTYMDEPMGTALRLEESGEQRLAATIGWLNGLYDAKYKHAERLMEDFSRVLHCMSRSFNQKREVEVEDRKYRVDPNIVRMYDDGSKHNFSFCEYLLVSVHHNEFEATHAMRELEKIESTKPLGHRQSYTTDGTYPCCVYRFFMNGGVIYHGPKDPEALAKWEPNDNWCWSPHT